MRDVACGFAARFRCGASRLACCAGKRFAFPQLRTLVGSNPSARCPNKNGPLSRTISNSMVGDEGCPRAAGAARFRFGPPALACCAGKRFAFPQLRTLAGSNPFARSSKRKAAIADSLIIHMVGDEGCRVRLRRPLPLRRFAPRVLRWKTLRVSSAPHPDGFESHARSPKQERPPLLEAYQIKWWAMRDSNPQPCACKAPALTVAPIARAERV